MLSKWLMLVLRVTRKLGVRVLLMTSLALLASVLAPLVDPLIPDSFKQRFGRDAVLPVLDILASSMLATTTFSLGVMVQAFQAASGQATPRAYRILMQDRTTHMVLATFVSTFLFSLTAIVMFSAEYYSDAAAVVIFGLTVFSIVLIIVAILRWIDHLSQLGSMDHTLRMVENDAASCLRAVAEAPCLGANEMTAPHPPDLTAILSESSGYVQFIDMPGLHAALEAEDARLWIATPPGTFVLEGAPLGHLAQASEALVSRAQKYFTLGRERTLEQDARYGLIVLSEIAARALSPGVNDPGTAIDVTHRIKRLLWEHAGDSPAPQAIRYPRAHVPRIQAGDLLEDGFDVIIRDGAGRPEVIQTVLKALDALSRSAWDELSASAREKITYAMEHAEAALSVKADRDRISRLAPVEKR